MVMPPALPPRMPSFALLVYFCAMRYSAQAMKSFQVLGLVALNPALCQSLP